MTQGDTPKLSVWYESQDLDIFLWKDCKLWLILLVVWFDAMSQPRADTLLIYSLQSRGCYRGNEGVSNLSDSAVDRWEEISLG